MKQETELLIDLHKDGERQGPGSRKATQMALELTGIPTGAPVRIADIGCGTGAQTLVLAGQTTGQIDAVDLFPQFLEELNQKVNALGLGDRIRTVTESMDALTFAPEEFDLVWSEGAIYLMGFEQGIREWRKFIKPGGFLVVSEICWTTGSRPDEVEAYWQKAYAQMDTAAGKLKVLEDNNYLPAGHFILDQECWENNYYRPLENRFEAFLARHGHSGPAKRLVESEQEEIRFYRRFSDYYSYGFFVARKV